MALPTARKVLTKRPQPNQYYYTISEVLCQLFARLNGAISVLVMKYYLIDENIRSVITFCVLFPFALTVKNHDGKRSQARRIFARKFFAQAKRLTL